MSAVKPPSDHAMRCLASAVRSPYPALDINPGVRWKLCAWDYISLEKRPSPYKHGATAQVDYVVATPAGVAAVETWRRK